MPRYILIGGLRPEVQAAETLELPYLDGLETGAVLRDVLDAVAATRRGGGVFGPKGSGKSAELAVQVEHFHEAEAAREDADAAYRPRRVVVLQAPRGQDGPAGSARGRAGRGAAPLVGYRAVLLAMLREIIGAEPSDRVRARRKENHELLRDAAEETRGANVAVVAVEEAERLAPDGLTALRDFMAEAEARDPGRQARGPGDARAFRAGGVGVLLVGTPDVRSWVEGTPDAGERWSHCESVAGLPAASVPDVFRHFFPAFADAERLADAGVGEGAWRAGIIAIVAAGRPTVSLRMIENHARNYFRLLVNDAPPEAPALTRETAPYDADVFALAAERANWHLPPADPSAVAKAAARAVEDAAHRAA